MDSAAIEPFFATLQAADPHPTTELIYGSDFQLLAAVILSAQATDVSVNRATARLFADAGTPDAMLALGEERLADYIRTIGLYRGKARNLIGGGYENAAPATMPAAKAVGCDDGVQQGAARWRPCWWI